MKSLFLSLLLASILLTSCGKKTTGTYSGPDLGKPKEFMDQVSYTIGLDMGKRMREDSLKTNVDYLALGIAHGLAGDSTKFLMTKAETDTTQKKFSDFLMKRNESKMKQQQEQMKAQGEKNKGEGQKFLDANKNKPGVKTTADGLQYEVLKEGTGKQAAKGDMVKVQLVAKYTDGKEFDNTYNRQAPVSLPVNEQIIPAWREALTMMKEGGKMRIVVPPNLGWGEAGMPPTIPPNSVLIFEIELVSVNGKAPAPGAQMQPQGGGPRPQ